eukprot:8578424-Ditylum_brightwellii.AAC.1
MDDANTKGKKKDVKEKETLMNEKDIDEIMSDLIDVFGEEENKDDDDDDDDEKDKNEKKEEEE